MKRLKKLIFVMLIILVPYKVMAFEGSFSVSCNPTTVSASGTVECMLKGTSDQDINKIEANITVSDGLTITDYTLATGWSGNDYGEVGNYHIASSNSSNVSGSFDIGTLKLKVADTATNGNLNIGFVSIVYFDDSSNEYTISNVSFTITVNNGEVKKGLKNLSVEGYSLAPPFDLSKYDYTVVIDKNTFKIVALPANANDTVTIYNIEDKSIKLDPDNITFVANNGMMKIVIVVGDGGTGNEYTISIKRKTEKYDNTLASLTVGGKKVECDAKDECYVYLDDVSSYEVNATVSDPDNFEIDSTNGGIGSYRGESNIIIIVKPKDSSLGLEGRTYTIDVKKSAGTSSGGSSSDIPSNPQTGNISIFIITLILIASLIVSLHLYRKNMEYYQ